MTNVFEHVKNNTDIIEVAKRYGIEINKQDKALCIFHDEKTPSMSFFKDKYFTCFSCRAKGSAIDLVMKLFNLTAIDACKKINDDFDLGLDLANGNYKPDTEQIKRLEHGRKLKESLKNWIDETHSEYSTLRKKYQKDLKKYKPSLENEEISDRYAEAVNKIKYVEQVLDILVRGTTGAKTELYNDLHRFNKFETVVLGNE